MLTLPEMCERIEGWKKSDGSPIPTSCKKQYKETLKGLMELLNTEDVFLVFINFEDTYSALKRKYKSVNTIGQKLKNLRTIITRFTQQEIQEAGLAFTHFDTFRVTFYAEFPEAKQNRKKSRKNMDTQSLTSETSSDTRDGLPMEEDAQPEEDALPEEDTLSEEDSLPEEDFACLVDATKANTFNISKLQMYASKLDKHFEEKITSLQAVHQARLNEIQKQLESHKQVLRLLVEECLTKKPEFSKMILALLDTQH